MYKEFIYSVKALVLHWVKVQVKEMLTKPLIIITSSFMMQSKKKRGGKEIFKDILSKSLDRKYSDGALGKQDMRSNFSVTKI